MDIVDKYNWTIIYTDYQKKFIHSDYLLKSNPSAQILFADISNNFNQRFAWKNCDKLVREWLKKNIVNIQYNNIAILEWDVLVSKPLPNISINGLVCKNFVDFYNSDALWFWFKEKHLLETYEKYACGIAPFGVFFLSLNAAHIWISEEFDHIYQKDIFCELRFPSILNSKQIPINTHYMPNVYCCEECLYKEQYDIHHPIKSSISIT